MHDMRAEPLAGVNTSKLIKQLKKELTRNTKKTVALGLVTLVALWFWAPLAWKWIGGDAKKKKSRQAAVAAAAETAASAAAATEAAKPVAKATPQFDWRELLDRIGKDELMTTARLPRNVRDPFGATPAEKQALAVAPLVTPGVPGAPAVARPVQIDPTPDEVGLKLEATFISGHVRRAVISGKTYRQGDRVRIASAGSNANSSSDPTDGDLEYELKVIEAKRVVLARREQEFPLMLKRETLDENDQLTFGTVAPATN